MEYSRELKNSADNCVSHYAAYAYNCNRAHYSLALNKCLAKKEGVLLKSNALSNGQFLARGKAEKSERDFFRGLLSLFFTFAILIFSTIDHAYGVDYLYKTDEEIQEVLCYVHDTIRDVNFDGELNCIDYAVRAYEVLPYSKIMRIDAPWMNHLYIRLYNGRDIEPQHWYDLNFDMYDVWGTEYQFDKILHRDETNLWKSYASKKEW